MQKNLASSAIKSAGSPWLAELGLLEGLLSEARRGLPLSITISNHYMRYRLVPAPPLSMPSAGVQSLIQHCFRETYGDVVDDWQIRANPMPDSGDVVACAVDRALMEGLRAMVDKYGLRLVSAQPYFMSGFNATCRRIDGAPACFVQAEPGRIMLGTVRDKKWQGLRALAATPQWEEELSAHIEREFLHVGWENASPTVFLHAPEAAQAIMPIAAQAKIPEETRRWKLNLVSPRHIAGYSPQHDVPYAMALSGVR